MKDVSTDPGTVGGGRARARGQRCCRRPSLLSPLAQRTGAATAPLLPELVFKPQPTRSHGHVPSCKPGCGLLSICVPRSGPTGKRALWVWCVADQTEAQGCFTCASSTSRKSGGREGGQNRAPHLGRQGVHTTKKQVWTSAPRRAASISPPLLLSSTETLDSTPDTRVKRR